MKLKHNNFRVNARKAEAFTLVEMLVVIAIIGILAGMIFGVGSSAIKKANKGKVVAAFKELEFAIESYHKTFNTYPSDNATNTQVNSLFYELMGTTWNSASNSYDMTGERVFETDVKTYFNQDGLRNVTLNAADPQAPKSTTILAFKEAQYTVITNATASGIRVLRVPVKDAETNMLTGADGNLFNAWRYRSTKPEYNKGKYDLWAEFIVGSTRYRVSNWERDVVMIENPKM